MRVRSYNKELDSLSDYISDQLNITEDEAFKAACKLEKVSDPRHN